FIPTTLESFDQHTPLVYDSTTIDLLNHHDLGLILRLENDKREEVNNHLVDQLVELNTMQDDTAHILFYGTEAIGFPEADEITSYVRQLTEAEYQFQIIEFAEQQGMQTVARSSNYEVIRLHSIPLTEELDENISQAVRAVKERNNRTVFFRFPAGL